MIPIPTSHTREYWLYRALKIKYGTYQSPDWFRTYVQSWINESKRNGTRTKTHLS